MCWSTPCTIAATQTGCLSTDTIDGVDKDRAVEKSLKSLDQQIEKWKADNGVTGPCYRNCGKAAGASVLAKLRSIFCIPSTRCRERLGIHDLLDRRGVASSLYLRRPCVLVRY